MKTTLLAAAVATAAFAIAARSADPPANGPVYTNDGHLETPTDFREWVFLSAGLDMSYSARSADPDMHMFSNVFAEPAAYRSFLATGTWPDKTLLVLELRGADSKGSINKRGRFQTTERMGVEVHVKDTARFAGGWAFFTPGDAGLAAQIPMTEDCYACHRDHAAVDTTFVQFYPTLLPVAESKGTLSAGYLQERSGPKAGK